MLSHNDGAGRESHGLMFQEFPLVGSLTLPSGSNVTVPYHNYSSEALLIHGLADPEEVRKCIAVGYHPVLLDGRAVASLWVIDYRNTSIGPYKELVMTFLVSEREHTAKSIHCVNALMSQPGFHQYVWRLWLDKELPIEYGRVLLGCDKHRADIQIERIHNEAGQEVIKHSFVDETGAAICSGVCPTPREAHSGPLIGELGLKRAVQYTVSPPPYIRWSAITPPDVMSALPGKCPMWSALFATTPKFSWASKNASTLDINPNGALGRFQFAPQLYQFDPRLQAILLSPWAGADTK